MRYTATHMRLWTFQTNRFLRAGENKYWATVIAGAPTGVNWPKKWEKRT